MKPVFKDDAEKPAWAEAIEREAADRGVSLDDAQAAANAAWAGAIEREAENRGMSSDEFVAHMSEQAKLETQMVEFMRSCGVEVRGLWSAAHLAQYAKPFKDNSEKVRKGGAIRVAIAKQLKKTPGMKNKDLWYTIAAKPPKGWEFLENDMGMYAEGPGVKNMDYRRFCNVCAEERGKLKA
jgi:hypothetical protein